MKKAKWISGLTILAASIAVFAGCSTSGKKELESSNEENVLKIGTEGTYSPFSYYNDKDELVGYDVDVAKAIAGKIGYKAEFIDAPWDSMLAAFDAKKTDVIFNQVTVTEERKAKYDFSNPYSISHGAIIVRKDNNLIKELSDLRGKKSAQTLTSNYAYLAEKNGATIVNVDGFSKSVELVENKQVDVTLNNDVAFYDYLKQKPNAAIKIAEISNDITESAAALHKGNSELLEKINKAIKELEEDGTLERLSKQYFNKDISK